MIRHSYTSESSDDSLLLSGSSRDSWESGSGRPLLDGTSLLTVAAPNPHAARKQRAHCKLCQVWSHLSDRQKLQELVTAAVTRPDSIRWKTPPVTVKLERDNKGSLCFDYKDVKGETTEKMYTLVKRVSRDGPAYRKICPGDCILSANGQPLDSSQDVTLRSVVSVNKTRPVCLIIQHPEAIICRNKSGQRARPQRSISQERGTGGSSQRSHSQLERMDSGKMSTNSSHDSKPPSECAAKGVEERLQGLLDSEDNLTCLDAHMPRLPRLQVLIAGSEASALANALLGGVQPSETQSHDLGVCYRGSATKTSSGFSMQASDADLKEWAVELLESAAVSRSTDLSHRVELEVTALHTHPFSTYCHQILATAHAIYVVQFRCQDFVENTPSVLLDIQRRLNKICTYASGRAPVYLVMTMESSLPSERLSEIGQTLHLHFADAFTNQLQYNAETNLPCFPVLQTSAGDHTSSCSSNCDSEAEQCCTISKKGSGMDAVYSVRDSHASSTALNAPGPKYDVGQLRDHVARAAFEQRFVLDRYPLAYLLHRERVQKLKRNGVHYAYKANIMQECTGIATERDLSSLLRFLHDSGDILCADFLLYKDSYKTVCLQTTSNNVLLDRQCLISAAKRLTTVPSRAQLQEDGCLPGSISQWEDLRTKYTASSTFLEQLLGNEAANILASLRLVNLLHLLHRPSPQIPISYLVPFFFPHDSPDVRQAHGLADDPNLYQLCLDFHGSIPDGVFLQVLVRLLERSWETRGRWSIEGTTTACLTLANDCEMTLVCDEMQSIIRIHARCRVTFKGQDLVVLLSAIVDDLKYCKSDLRISMGPPCPLPAHLCKIRARGQGKTHVIDIGYGRAPAPLWCGDQQIDQHPLVTHWMIRPADILQVTLGPRHERLSVSLQTHIKNFPPKLFNWLCNHLNVPPVDKDWHGVAHYLGYKICEVHTFEVQRSSVLDPCRSLLLDWARYPTATLENLINILDKDLQRYDIMTDLQEEWLIVT